MKSLRFILVAVALSAVATASFAVSARATPSTSLCGPWDYCFCMDFDCYMGDQLCASSDRFVCYQP